MRSVFSRANDFSNFGNFGNFGGGGRGTSRQVRTETRPDGTVITTIIENGKKTTTVQKKTGGGNNNKQTNFNDFFNDNDWGFDIKKRFGFGNVDEEDNNNNNNNNKNNTKYITIGNYYKDFDDQSSDNNNNNNNKFSYDFDYDNNNNNNQVAYEYEEVSSQDDEPSPPVSASDFQKECLAVHNQYRRKHHVKDLVLNEELNQIAQKYANKLAETNSFQHSGNTKKNGEPLGENLFMCYGFKITGEKMSTDWYNEVQNYNYNADYQSGKGHFTQLVWKGTTQVGFAYAQSRDGSYYGVANYYPAGNYLNEFRRNVLKP